MTGQNGSGKSTLVKALLGFVSPMQGKIIKDGTLKNAVGYLPQQQPAQNDFPASVREIVLSAFQGRKKFFSFYTAKEKQLVEENMEKMQITHLANRSFKELSGGQRQRVLLARALCAATRMLLLDEPAAGLDPIVNEKLYETIADLRKDGMTVVMVSHDLDRALPVSSHVLQLGQTMQYFGPTSEFDPESSLKEESKNADRNFS